MSEAVAPDSVVVATDGSAHAERAVRWAGEQAALEGRRLVVVSCGEDAGPVVERTVAAVTLAHPDLDVRGFADPGDPRRVLLDLASRARLLVLGSRGRGTVRSILLGSVSTAVSAHAGCPVVVCRPSEGAQAVPGVMVGADSTPESVPVLEFAYRIADLRDLPLTVRHCFWDAVAAVADYRESRGEPVEVPELEELHASLAASVAGLAEVYPDVQVTLSLEHGLVDEALSPRGQAWDLVVVGRHPMASIGRVLTGSIATAVVARSASTVAVVPEPVGHG
ncbi:MAG: universal stress protein [Nocardioides sp.]